MSVRSYPFAGEPTGHDESGFPKSDRDYNEEDFARILTDLKEHGVTNRGNNPMLVTAAGGMKVRINYGTMFINGRYAEVYDEPEYLTLEPGDGQPRIELISMRLDTITARAITPVIIRGTPSASPVMPELKRDDFVHDMVLAKIYVPAEANSITQDGITDTRQDKDLCGMRDWSMDDRGRPNGVAPLVDGVVPKENLPGEIFITPKDSSGIILGADEWFEPSTVSHDDVLYSQNGYFDFKTGQGKYWNTAFPGRGSAGMVLDFSGAKKYGYYATVAHNGTRVTYSIYRVNYTDGNTTALVSNALAQTIASGSYSGLGCCMGWDSVNNMLLVAVGYWNSSYATTCTLYRYTTAGALDATITTAFNELSMCSSEMLQAPYGIHFIGQNPRILYSDANQMMAVHYFLSSTTNTRNPVNITRMSAGTAPNQYASFTYSNHEFLRLLRAMKMGSQVSGYSVDALNRKHILLSASNGHNNNSTGDANEYDAKVNGYAILNTPWYPVIESEDGGDTNKLHILEIGSMIASSGISGDLGGQLAGFTKNYLWRFMFYYRNAEAYRKQVLFFRKWR